MSRPSRRSLSSALAVPHPEDSQDSPPGAALPPKDPPWLVFPASTSLGLTAPEYVYLEGDEVLLRTYRGEVYVEFPPTKRWIRGVVTGKMEGVEHQVVCEGGNVWARARKIRLAMELDSVRDHVARVISKGVKCSNCDGSGWRTSMLGTSVGCPTCGGLKERVGEGWILPPAIVSHLVDGYGTCVHSEMSGLFLGWSYRSWAKKGPVLRHVRWEARDRDKIRPCTKEEGAGFFFDGFIFPTREGALDLISKRNAVAVKDLEAVVLRDRSVILPLLPRVSS